MKKQTTITTKTKSPAPKPKASHSRPRTRRLEGVVGRDVYQIWVDMLRVLVPDGRPLLGAAEAPAVDLWPV